MNFIDKIKNIFFSYIIKNIYVQKLIMKYHISLININNKW